MDDVTVGTTPQTGTIHVLLVDDNDQWAEFVATNVERAADDIEMTVVLSANEAMLTVQERDDVDCIVTDYRMPEVDGIQLLERIREDHPDLPFLLMTGEGSEDIAARAIDAGVTDYLVKNPSADQTTMLVDKIRSAVERHRRKHAIAESEQRYRTVTEQSRDAIAIFQNGTLVFCNQRLVELAGRDRTQLRSDAFIDIVVHPEDRDRIRAVADSLTDGDQRQSLYQTRIARPDGEIRHCEFTGQQITYEGKQAALVSIRDITDRKQRERELEWERELNRTVQEALVESRTRADLEQAVAAQLQRQGYALAWVAEQHDGTLVPRVVQGDRTYVDTIDLSLSSDGNDSEPSIWAARSGHPQFLEDFEDLFPTEWRETALECGYRGGAAIPLVYNDISYGLLVVYHDQPNRLDDTERRLLTELADTVAFAIHSLETENALASDHSVAVTLQVDDDAYYLVSLAHDGAFVDCERVQVRGTVPDDDDAVIQYLTLDCESASSVCPSIDAHPDIEDVVVISEDGPIRLQVTTTGPVPEAALAARGVVVDATRIRADGATVEIELPARETVRSTVETLEDTFDSVSVVSVVERDADETTADAEELTEKQATALEAAYHHGYFERPRRSSASDIADSLGIAHSTFLQHLRVAQQKVFEQRFQ